MFLVCNKYAYDVVEVGREYDLVPGSVKVVACFQE